MKGIKILSAFLVTCLLISVLAVQSVAANGYSTVSGVISLPDNDIAPSGGVKILLIIGTDNNTPNDKNDDKSVTTELTIPKGLSSVAYTVQVPKSQNTKAKYSVYYTAGNGYAPFGWYSSSGTTAIKENRTLIDVNAGNVSGVDIRILPGRTISGCIVLDGKSRKPLNDLKYTVTAIQEGSNGKSNDDDIIVSKEVTIKANDYDISYELTVPINSAKKGYKVYYTYENQGYIEKGYYHRNGTSRDENEVTLIDVANTSVKDIDLTTLPFINITGKVNLPDNEKAAGKDIEVTVTAYNNNSKASASDDFSFSKTVKIPKGSDSAEYSLTVPAVSTDYIVSYKVVTKNPEYITEGYYSNAGTMKDKKDATPLKAEDKNITGIDLDIISKKPDPKPGPKPDPDKEIIKKYDLNGDGYVNVYDLLDLAKVIVDQYEKKGFDKNLEQYNRKLDEKDLDIIKKVFKPFTNNRHKVKWFNNVNNWFNFEFDWEKYDWSKFDWSKFDWSKFDWSKFDWGKFDWSKFDWNKYFYWNSCKDYFKPQNIGKIK